MDTVKSQSLQGRNSRMMWNSALDEDLLEKQFVSQIIKSGDHVTLNITGEGIKAILKGLKKIVDMDDSRNSLPELEGLVSRKDVMVRLGVSHTTLNNWEKDGILVPVVIGRKQFYRKNDVIAREK